MKIVHIADVHFRGLTRHAEYRHSFIDFFNKVKVLKPDVIYIGGDIVHSKTQGISPELIDILSWWFTEMATIAPTHIILGNHDGLMLNKDRQDAISPIITALNNPNLFLYKNSGTYPTGIPGFNWCVFSCFDEEGWKGVQPAGDDVNIALFHGGVRGSSTDINWSIDGEVTVDFFDSFDFALLGDIHKYQYLNEEKTIAYCGSSIQQNYGEDPGKGFLFWDIKDKENFSCEFFEIDHSQPFVTIDWQGSTAKTIEHAKDFPDRARYRVRSDSQINQLDIKHIYNELKEIKKASEVVFKHDAVLDVSTIKAGDSTFDKEDLRSPSTHKKLIREYLGEGNITSASWEKIDGIVDQYIGRITHQDDMPRNTKWSIRSLEFDNTFAYGKGNKIAFDNFSGITGIFGKNRSGKSSIVGTLMYGLFNTTDRGTIKNLHIINSRKGQCSAKVSVNINGKNYRIERQSVKHQNRKGVVSATTYLAAYRIDANGEVLQDLTEEQRRESEKVVKKLIGTSEDFLMTSLASQGGMNTFIKEKATQRKSILSNFLDLNMFDEMSELIRDESSNIKTIIKNSPERDWEQMIESLESEKKTTLVQREKVEKEHKEKFNILQSLRISIATHKDKDIVTRFDVKEKDKQIKNLSAELTSIDEQISSTSESIKEGREKLIKIEKIKNQFPIAELKSKLSEQKELQSNLVELNHQIDKEKTLLKNQKNSLKKLSEVPCGDSFPSCKFIKDSHTNKILIPEQEKKINAVKKVANGIKKTLKRMDDEKLQEKIEKYNEILNKQNSLEIKISEQELRFDNVSSTRSRLASSLQKSKNELQDMRLRVSGEDSSNEIAKLRKKASVLESDVNDLDAKRIGLSEKSGRVINELRKAIKDYEQYKKTKAEWKIYEMLGQAFSKKGIPLQIIMSQLPVINSEISRILQEAVGFTVELEADLDSNAMDVYINYGDSRRIIELASGMEKMMASLAIRVALINVSTLPKTDILIIDEGFGALDSGNIEACTRLLESMKKWFKHILIISHVDAVKDVVDNVIDITKSGKDSKVLYA